MLPLPFESGVSVKPAPAVSLAGLRALIVSENEVNRRVAAGADFRLGKARRQLRIGLSMPWEAIRLAQTKGDRYDFTFVCGPSEMPGMDGAALAGWIKADPANRDTVFILVTSIGPHGSQIEGYGKNKAIDGWLAKPVRQSHLLNVLASAWSKKQPLRT